MEELQERVEKLEAELKKLQSNSTIPLEVDKAFRKRLGISDLASLEYVNSLAIPVLSAKGANSEDVNVDEGGAATYQVMNDPVGFLEVSVEGVLRYIPYFNA